ncbi:hypothetical protein DICPUDRAFT_91788 [Dictyostelium purpureum]|uniref:Uncharacterized protein n=1 Tax=Dictyostelium purpureum TaxID=5786 RepID=F0ZH49_DICPU|nr:uncharacterized protein DICPUDRAFT_91788 [Dictyostelium purpureum]EGC36730.1 hypothetical protein DICPUDRAFT_91788 [Dictyostelium purpureum]|eukprot:XP_003286755.1 hypothetical protein DICPUDRAFT_91788 [Dictyostelium purpureum]
MSNTDNNKKVIILTGGSDGIGRNALNYLVKEDNTKIILPVRNLEKGEKVIEELKQINPNADLKLMKMDLSSQESIKSFVNEFNSLNEPLDILVNNAGILTNEFRKNSDGYELTMGTNHLGTSLLTLLLLPNLNKSKLEGGGNIVIVSSKMHSYIGSLDFDKELGNETESDYSSTNSYSKSKLYNLLFAQELQKKLDQSESSIKVNALHPGFTMTSLAHEYNWFARGFTALLTYLIGDNLDDMGRGLAELALNKSNIKGKYLNITQITQTSKFAQDPSNSLKLWEKTCQMLGFDSNNLKLN